MLGKRVRGEMVNQIGKVTGYPGLEAADCPTLTGKQLIMQNKFESKMIVQAPFGWVGCTDTSPGGDSPPFDLTDDETLQLNTRQCVELCR